MDSAGPPVDLPVSPDITLLSQSNAGGLFSQINFIITHIEALGHADFYTDWTSDMPHAQIGSVNLFDHLFYQNCPVTQYARKVRSWPNYRYTGTRADLLYLSDYDGWRWRLNDCWNLLKVRDELLHEVAKFCDSWSNDVCALHVRNFKIGAECPGGIAPTLENYESILRRFSGPIFLATDNEEAICFFKSLLGDRLITRTIGRSPDMNTEYHLNYPQSVRDAQNCLIDALIMSRCHHLIHSVSNISTAVLYINPEMDHTYVRSGGAVRIPSQKRNGRFDLVKQTLKSSKPITTANLIHQKWCDKISIFQNQTFACQIKKDLVGTLTYLPSGDLEIHWLNEEKEWFFIENAKAMGDSKSHFTEHTYHIKTLNRVAVDLAGGLGDQMFQYAFGLAIAKAWGNAELRIAQTKGENPFLLGRFGIYLSRLIPVRKFYIEWYEDYDDGIVEEMLLDIIKSEAGSLWLEGRFQNAGFFAHAADEIRKSFLLPNLSLAKFVGGNVPVAVHVKAEFSDARHSLLPISYYRDAIRKMKEIIPDSVFLVFSDESREYLEFFTELESEIVILPPMDEFDAMIMMQSCKALILSDSTTCWWSAWLSCSNHIIYPKLVPSEHNQNMYPSGWICSIVDMIP